MSITLIVVQNVIEHRALASISDAISDEYVVEFDYFEIRLRRRIVAYLNVFYRNYAKLRLLEMVKIFKYV